MSEWEQLFVLIFIGCCFGSFLNVVIYRLPRGKSIIHPGSRCGFCKSAISALSNIPIFGYLLSFGRCQKCGHIFSVRYLIIELLTPLVFVLIWWQLGWGLTPFILMAFSCVLIAASWIDIDLRIIPDSLTLGAWGIALIAAALAQDQFPVSFTESLIGSAVGFLFFYILSRGYALVMGDEGLGGGDVKFMGFIGAVLGFEGVMTTVFVASLLGALVGVVMISIFGATRKYPIPFGPYLSFGAFLHAIGISIADSMSWLKIGGW